MRLYAIESNLEVAQMFIMFVSYVDIMWRITQNAHYWMVLQNDNL